MFSHLTQAVVSEIVILAKNQGIEIASEYTQQTVGKFLAKGIVSIMPSLAIQSRDLEKLSKGDSSTGTADALREMLDKKVLRKPMPVTVRGVFLPGKLLTFGWWEEKRSPDIKTDWQLDRGIQRWLFSGFEQWAPSWSLLDWEKDDLDYFVGQVGTNDEADSILVIANGPIKARKVRDDMNQIVHTKKINVTKAEITGLLCHGNSIANYVPESKKAFVQKLVDARLMPKYCIIVSDEVSGHKIDFGVRHGTVEYYSGYLWKCMCPEELKKNPGMARVLSSYFIWEHTDFSNHDALNYNMDSLCHKVKYLENRVKKNKKYAGKFALLQELMPEHRLRDGDTGPNTGDLPALKIEEFEGFVRDLVSPSTS